MKNGAEYIYGDWAYGEEYDEQDIDDPAEPDRRHLADELWGDDDIIYGGDAENLVYG